VICKNPAPGGPGIDRAGRGRERRGGNGVFRLQPSVVHAGQWGEHRSLLSHHRYSANSDLQFLVSDEETFFHDERRNTTSKIELIDPGALGFKITNTDPEGRYSIEKQIIGDPHLTCLLIHTKFNVAPEWQGGYIFMSSVPLIWK